ncbi:hypothetical protein EJ08DRAFT_659251 [Tothia fuscella]|uniref:Heterokaryon incompatibility domain-containing protein n=1 Tax=Tothia fuscella TaxID=1048955 RepID=A0A9P4U0T9_9PEZI|nr:hypothetical protein EJ08DRAFT_659251 [Tothia fuscella]
MGSIYSNAELVIAWIGAEDGQLSLAMKTCQTIASERKKNPQYYQDLRWMQKYPWLLQVDQNVNTGIPNQAWKAVVSFFARPYWRRVWILQEMALAKKLWIMSSADVIDFDDLVHFCSVCHTISRANSIKPVFFPSKLWMSLSYRGTLAVRVISLKVLLAGLMTRPVTHEKVRYDTLTYTRRHLATDPRDKIFALQGLMKNIVTPDYDKSVAEVYCDFAGNISGLKRVDLKSFEGQSWVSHALAICLKLYHSRFRSGEVCAWLEELKTGFDHDPLASIGPGLILSERWGTDDALQASQSWFSPVATHIRGVFKNYRFFSTAKGYYGWAPPGALPGDLVSILHKSSVPVLLRPEKDYYKHVGNCFVLGFMDGEASKYVSKGSLQIQEFVIH